MTSYKEEALLQSFEAYLQKEGYRLNTVRGYAKSAGIFLEWIKEEGILLEEAAYSDLLAWIDQSRKKGNRPHTINNKLRAVRHLYNHLQQRGEAESNPCEELRIKGEVRRQPHDLLEWEELETLYENYPAGNLIGKRNKVLLGMLIYQGLNSGEAGRLETGDVKLEEGKVYVPAVGRSNSRTLKLESSQVLELQKYITQVRPIVLAITGKESEKLFVSIGQSHRLDNSMSRMLKKATAVNRKVKSIHQIRASVITHWLKQYNIRQVQYMIGHRYVSSTDKYRTDLLESLQDQIDELHPLSGEGNLKK